MRSRLFAMGLVAVAVLAPTTPAVATDIKDGTLAQARAATAKFHNIDRALEAGYVQASPCEPGQGYHYVNFALAGDDGRLDVSQPEVLLYEPGPNGKLRLVGVEYVRFYPSFSAPKTPPYVRDANGPSMFGVDFHGPMAGHAPGMPDHHELHVWVWRHSPEGMFEARNSRIVCP